MRVPNGAGVCTVQTQRPGKPTPLSRQPQPVYGEANAESSNSKDLSLKQHDKAQLREIFLHAILGGVKEHEAQTTVPYVVTPAASELELEPEPEPEPDNCEGLGDPFTQPKNFSDYIQSMSPCVEEKEDRREFLRMAVKATLRIPPKKKV